MPSGWEVYYVVFLSALLALAIPAGLAFLSFLVSPGRAKTRPAAQRLPKEGSAIGRRINTRFFLSANAALVLITLSLILIPCVSALASAKEDRALLARALACTLSIAGFAALGLLYAARKGDLDWLRSYTRSSGKEPK